MSHSVFAAFRFLSLVFGGLAILFFAGCGKAGDADSDRLSPQGLFTLRVQLDWRPEPQHGGLYQALVDGYFAEEGLEVVLIPGGTNALVTQVVATGGADIGQSATTQVILFRSNGFPLTNVASVFHWAPSALMMHESNPISDFSGLDGKQIMARPEAIYIPYLKKRYGIDFEVVPQSFGLGGFLADKNFIQEGFFISEPYFLEQRGARVKWLALHDAGYSPYAVLFSSDSFLDRYPEQMRAFLRAYTRGWETYLGDGHPRAHERMKEDNSALTDGFLEFGRHQIIKYNLVTGDPVRGESIATIDPERVDEEIRLMEEVGVLKPGAVRVEEVVATEFLVRPDNE